MKGQSEMHSSTTADVADMPEKWVLWWTALQVVAALTKAQA